ncbi:MAG: hypothetical protein N3F66_13290 [Spirochaetes bacterium]|nr:hypothetical protein [Spirochaetota bacterium]
MNLLQDIVPTDFVVSDKKPVDASGYVPKTVDYIAYYKKWNIIDQMMNGHIPSELVYATFHVVEKISAQQLPEVLNNVALTKKLNKFAEVEESVLIPAFIIAANSDIDMPQLKNAILDYYVSRSVSHELEFDIMMIIGKGVIIKDWREKRKFVALETEEDTLLWFFILMNEYLDVDKKHSLDLRNYVKETRRYKEY